MLQIGCEKIELDVLPTDPRGPNIDELVAFYTKIFNKFTPAPMYRIITAHEEECPWFALVKMTITKTVINIDKSTINDNLIGRS